MCLQRDITNGSEAAALRRKVIAELRACSAAPNDDLDAAEYIVGELLSNAFRYTPGHVCIELNWDAQRARLTMHDAGRGFEWAPHLPANPESESGRGSYILSLLALDVSVTSDANGCRVTVTLPVARPATPPPREWCPMFRTFDRPGVCAGPRGRLARAT